MVAMGSTTGARRETPEAIAERATPGFGSWDIVLLHDADHCSAVGSWREPWRRFRRSRSAPSSTGSRSSPLAAEPEPPHEERSLLAVTQSM